MNALFLRSAALARPQTASARFFATKSLYVGNLSWSTTQEDVMAIFRPFCEVTTARIIKGPDGRSRGFGFVELVLPDEAAAEAAKTDEVITALNGSLLSGRTLRVRWSPLLGPCSHSLSPLIPLLTHTHTHTRSMPPLPAQVLPSTGDRKAFVKAPAREIF